MQTRIIGKRGTYNGREITGLIDYDNENKSVIFTVFYRIEGYKTKTFCWITETNERCNMDIEYANRIVQQITAIIGTEELKIFEKLLGKLKENLF